MNKLKEKRMQRELSQFQLAKASGVSLRMLQKYEQGDRDINKAQAGTVYKLAKTLNCQMEEIINTKKDLD